MKDHIGFVWLLALALFASPMWAAGTLVVCDDLTRPKTLDPHRQFSEKNQGLLQQIYDGLVRFDPQGRVEGALAVRWERVDDLRTRFELRRGVRFHNGEAFDAQSVRYTLERYLDPEVGFPARSFLEPIDGVEVIDDHTVEIVTKARDGLLLERLAGFVLIVPPNYVREHGPDALEVRPIGTGAFRFGRWEGDHALHLDANPDYWRAGFPRLDHLVFRFASAEEQVDLLLRGDVDVVTELPGTLTRLVQSDPDVQVLKHKTYWTIGATMNNRPGRPLADPRLRRALNLALDRDDLIRYEARGNGSALASLTMEGQSGHNPELDHYRFDPEEARRLIAECGVSPPLRLRAHVRTQTERAAKIIAVQLKKAGIELELHFFDDAQALPSLNDPGQIWDIGIAGFPDAMCHSYFMQSVMLFSHSPFSLTRDEALDRRLIAMGSEIDPAEQDRLGRELDRYVYDQSLSLFTYQKIKTYGVRKGVALTPYISGMPSFYDATVEGKP